MLQFDKLCQAKNIENLIDLGYKIAYLHKNAVYSRSLEIGSLRSAMTLKFCR